MRLFTTLVVDTAANTYDLTDLATVKEELDISGSDTDAMLQRWITAASKRIAKYCDRVFPVEQVTETFRTNAGVDASIHQFRSVAFLGTGVKSLELTRRRLPTVSVESIVEDDTRTLVAGVDYTVDTENGIVYRLYNACTTNWPLFSKVVIQYHGGFATIPEDVAEACILLLRSQWLERKRDPNLRQITIEGVGTKTYWVPQGSPASSEPGSADDLGPNVAAKLNDYRGWSFA
jgi:hypothetical protein